MDAIPDPDVLQSGTNQGEFLGEVGQKKALRTTTEGGSAEEKAEHGERDVKSDSGNGERNSSSDGEREDNRTRERDCGEESGDGREERDGGRPGGGTDYDTFAHLLDKTNQEHVAQSWWREAPFVSTDIQESSIRRKLSKKTEMRTESGLSET
ncbi:hypothetical protein NDU88_001017 [Pleurodeles waltl]|uniref:Uncharacterized protein n=1 Tax=Pleurodeles waltl TaxID=8319 RepID=A0AAV7R7D3_PLEWA|nr:hypothetical protein NDU88_001017 [Pleurodeles waltl]